MSAGVSVCSGAFQDVTLEREFPVRGNDLKPQLLVARHGSIVIRPLHKGLFKILHLWRFFAFGRYNLMPFLFQTCALGLDAAGIFWVQAAIGFEHPPIRRDTLPAGPAVFFRRP